MRSSYGRGGRGVLLALVCVVMLLSTSSPAYAARPLWSHVELGEWGTTLPKTMAPDVVSRWLGNLLIGWLNEQAEAMMWDIPETTSWPLDEVGLPIITTRRVDRMTHTIGPYDRLSTFRRWMRYRDDRLFDLNPGVDFDALLEGQTITLWERDPEVISESVGRAKSGRLVDGEPLPPGENYTLIWPHRTFGTYYVISEVVRVLDAYREAYPDSVDNPLVVGDVSFRWGRRIKPHQSHRSGRDIDISFPRRDRPRSFRRFLSFPRRKLDVERTFWVLREFIRGGHIEYIFVDRRWSYLLYREAQRLGAPEAWIRHVFRSGRVLRHEPGHHDHFHIRFRCHDTDTRCS